MNRLWCWRCKMEIPMLDDEEFWQVLSPLTLRPGATVEERSAPFLQEYERITGFHETNFQPNVFLVLVVDTLQ